MTRHFLTLKNLSSDEIISIIDDAILRKKSNIVSDELKGKYLALIFEKSSTRTRVSFETAMNQLGGKASFLSVQDLQLGRGEPLADTSKVISSMADAIVLRTLKHQTITEFSNESSSPVINGLSDLSHPCQLLADIMTFNEHRGSIKGKKIAWIGDYNNMCKTYIEASKILEFQLHIATPSSILSKNDIQEDNVTISESMEDAVKDCNLITTDVWISMGDNEIDQKKNSLKEYQVTPELLDQASKEVIFFHCLPAVRGEEVSHEVMDDPRSLIWHQAENRMHAQKSLLTFLINN
jgi:ornithine carbamoyltransferase